MTTVRTSLPASLFAVLVPFKVLSLAALALLATIRSATAQDEKADQTEDYSDDLNLTDDYDGLTDNEGDEEELVAVAENIGDTCDAVAQLALRRCGGSRARRSCQAIALPRLKRPQNGSIEEGRVYGCVWLEHCMRCVPPLGALRGNYEDCILDGILYQGDATCPVPANPNGPFSCADCSTITQQEICLGLCSEGCKWTDLLKLRGEFCEDRAPPVPEESNLLFYIIVGASGFVGLIIFTACCVLCIRYRRSVVEGRKSKMEIDKQRKREMRGRNQGRGRQSSIDEDGRRSSNIEGDDDDGGRRRSVIGDGDSDDDLPGGKARGTRKRRPKASLVDTPETIDLGETEVPDDGSPKAVGIEAQKLARARAMKEAMKTSPRSASPRSESPKTALESPKASPKGAASPKAMAAQMDAGSDSGSDEEEEDLEDDDEGEDGSESEDD